MGYFRDLTVPAQIWLHRACVSVVHTSGLATTDITITIPPNWDHFWDNTLATGFDIRLTAADGETLLAYDVTAFNPASRVATIEIDNVTLRTDSRVYLLWIYYGNASAADASVGFVIGASSAGFIELARPSMFSVRLRPEQIGDLRPRYRIQKAVVDAVYIGIEIRSVMQRRDQRSARSRLYEEPFLARVRVQLAGVDQAPMVDGTKQRFVETTNKRLWILAFVQAGTTDTDYVIVPEIHTHRPPETAHRILEPRILLRVQDQTEG